MIRFLNGAEQITQAIQTVLAAQLVTGSLSGATAPSALPANGTPTPAKAAKSPVPVPTVTFDPPLPES